MRIHKFREWDKNTGRWNYFRAGEQWGDNGETNYEFTGLKDKNGKEIYEGDIVKCVKKNPTKYDYHLRKGVVVYRENEAAFVVENEAGYAIASLY